jgi:hypothetical protein
MDGQTAAATADGSDQIVALGLAAPVGNQINAPPGRRSWFFFHKLFVVSGQLSMVSGSRSEISLNRQAHICH